MKNENLFNGFNVNFLKDEIIEDSVDFPIIGVTHQNDIAPILGNDKGILNYLNYSVQLSVSRKFPFLTASNIDGALFKKANRATNWKKDERAIDYQWGQELYGAKNSNFDRGHMTKREDVQWGNTPAIAQVAADSTFFYSNAVPQHKELNQQIWKNLEDYILHTETRKNSLKVCVFTGPVLSNDNPPFSTPVNGISILLPILFWKIVLFPKEDGKIYRVGFMMSQNRLLINNHLVEELESGSPQNDYFMQFDDAATYQVNISLIEQLTDIKFPQGIDSYNDTRNIKLVLNEIDIDPDLESNSVGQNLGYSISNLQL